MSVRARCLLIAPLSFYSFHNTVTLGLERRGYSVDVINDEYPANAFGKVLGKIALRLLRILTLRSLKRRLAAARSYDLILIIKGRGLGPDAIRFLRSRADRVVGYNFDSFRFNPSPLDWYHLTDRYCTFDILDSKVFGIPLVHLFSAAQISPSLERPYDISIIQRVHSDRLLLANVVMQALPRDSKAFIFLYEASVLTFLMGFLRHPFLYLKMWPHISFKPLPYSKAMQALSRSRITFDFAHPFQSGVTIRCFESQSLGVAILTNNQNAVLCSLFSEGAVAYLPPNCDVETVNSLICDLLRRRPESSCRDLNDFLADLLFDI